MKKSWFRILNLLLVMTLFIFLGQSCGSNSDLTVWYGITDRGGMIFALQQGASSLLVALIPNETLVSFRKQLAAKGVESDDLGAVQYLFGLKGDHFFKADITLMGAVRDLLDALGGRFSEMEKGYSIEEHRLRTLATHAMDLSKNPLPDTLAALAGPQTTGEDITKALGILARRKLEVMYFNIGTFLDPSLSSDDLKRWTTEWTTHALRAAAR